MMKTDHRNPNILGAATIAEFESGLRGELIRPDDMGYDAARRVWNGSIDKYPVLIVRCAGDADIIRAVQFARSYNLPLAVRGGGHHIAGHAVCDDGLVVDLSRLKGIHVEPDRRIVHAQPGLTWGEFDRETQAFGLATTGGLISTTGLAGLTLGGGIGWLMRKHGLTCDNLLSVEVVTADGRLLTANANENTDLFWGVRGGGGNLGVVTLFEYQLHPVSQVIGGMILHPSSKAKELLHFYREYVATAPDELTTMFVFLIAPPAPFVPAEWQGKPVVAIVGVYEGAPEVGERVLRPLRQFDAPIVDLFQSMPYLTLQCMLDATAPPGLQNYWKSGYLKELSDEAIEALIAHATAMTSPLSAVHLHHLQGALSRIRADETAFGPRGAPFAFNLIATWQEATDSERHIAWAREFWSALLPYSTGGVYVNFLGEESEARVRAAYGENYERLVAVKTKYDPTNFFRQNQNIKPSDKWETNRRLN
jgi:FAD/FMN-containing dehydrogenase